MAAEKLAERPCAGRGESDRALREGAIDSRQAALQRHSNEPASKVDRLLRLQGAKARSLEADMIQQVFGSLFVLTLFVPPAAVILGAVSLAAAALRPRRGLAVNAAVHV